jgi:hypothetical protein
MGHERPMVIDIFDSMRKSAIVEGVSTFVYHWELILLVKHLIVQLIVGRLRSGRFSRCWNSLSYRVWIGTLDIQRLIGRSRKV